MGSSYAQLYGQQCRVKASPRQGTWATSQPLCIGLQRTPPAPPHTLQLSSRPCWPPCWRMVQPASWRATITHYVHTMHRRVKSPMGQTSSQDINFTQRLGSKTFYVKINIIYYEAEHKIIVHSEGRWRPQGRFRL